MTANDFSPYLKDGQRVEISKEGNVFDGFIGIIQGDRIPQDNLDVYLRSRGPVRRVFLERFGTPILMEEESLKPTSQ